MGQGGLSWWWYRHTAPGAARRERAARREQRRAERRSKALKPYRGPNAFARWKKGFRVRKSWNTAPLTAEVSSLGRFSSSAGKPAGAASYSGHRGGFRPVLIAAVLIFTVLAVFLLVIQSRMRPQVEQVAGAHIRNLASQAVNQAVAEAITRMGVAYDDLIHFEKDNQGRITALKTDMVMANRVKADIHTTALEKIGTLADTDIRIPLGSLMSGDLVVGRGPKIPVRLVPVGAVDVSFSNEFSTAGINQTLHRIMIHISTKTSVLLPGSSTEQEVMVEVCIAETVIVGVVPDAYASLDKNPLFSAE